MKTLHSFQLTGVVCLLAMTVACTPPAPAPVVVPDTHEADANAVRNAEAAWLRDIETKDIDKFVSHYADDAVLLFPNAPIIKGKSAIKDELKQALSDPHFSLSFQASRVDTAKELAYTQGTYKSTFSGPKQETLSDEGKYLRVWKKQSDGSWKVVADTSNSDLPLPPPPGN